MFGYGYASVEDSYEGVASRESLKLFKSEAEGVFGFYIEPGSGPFYSIDGSLGLTFYGVNNTYAAENNLKEKITILVNTCLMDTSAFFSCLDLIRSVRS